MTLANPLLQHFSINAFDEVYLTAVQRQQFEHQSAASQYANKYTRLMSTDTLFVILGTDSGLLANYLLTQGLASGSRYIFVEHTDILAVLTIDIEPELTDKLLIITPAQLADHLSQHQYSIYIAKNQFEFIQSLGCRESYFSDYLDLKSDCQQIIEHTFFQHAQHHKQSNFVVKQFINMADNGYPVARLRQLFLGKTAIVIGGGPSLDESIAWIAANQDKLIVIVVSRAVEQIHQAGIHIDIVVTVDPQDVSFLVSKAMFNLPSTSILIHSDHAVESLVGQWRYSHFYTGYQLPWQTEDNLATIGPTVTNTAIGLAVELGCTQVLLTGVDLCHSALGVSHASGSFHGSLGPKLDFIGEWVRTYSGQLAETTIQLFKAISSLEEQVATINKARVINLASSAAKVAGICHVTPENIVLSPIEDKAKQLAQVATTPNMLDKASLIAITQQLSAATIDLNAIQKHAQQALAICNHFQDSSHAKLDKIEHKLNKRYRTLMPFIKFYGYRYFNAFLTTSESSQWQMADIAARHRLYYQAIVTTSADLLELITLSQAKLFTRISEHNPNADLASLCQAWLSQKQPARYLIWLAKHPARAQQLTDGEQQLIADMNMHTQAAFSQDVGRNASGAPIALTLNRTPEKIQHLFKTGNAEGLYLVYQALDWYLEKDVRAKNLQARALAYYYELTQEYTNAFATLSALGDSRSEVEIKQLVMMALKSQQLHEAEKYLYQLLSFSDLYLPFLANVQKLAGNNQLALNTYLDYLDKYPEDIVTYIKLGNMLAELGEIQGAIDVFTHILTLMPEHPVALNALYELQNYQAQLASAQ
ncbi:DUF115 domain-containing protein [Shewanella sp. SNU WT4]|uniref:6-hydroxymethylpterin diphosphokinase MptE-like protein n=1 Tax=Shewanella sp. SNU WT4 TaxID=2590015 RepID=UPI00112E0D5F|nr:6-hydroxymethylpterin diphosphokinase MptE-like protein [Shewanella sp. SNU WT4]QDF66522.1 DUF115 domain-containing protein [Shewanella sp. SNU WT4]